ncbi:MAG: hypothetical protein WD512_04450, partial [Candidatus Paceibacterota bacterium]
NSYEDTEEINFTYFNPNDLSWPTNAYEGNARNTQKHWMINHFRDKKNIPEGVTSENQWAYERRMEDKYHIVHLTKDNTEGDVIFLFNSELNYKQSIR